MIVTQTPLRVSFFGGGTDLKDYYEKYVGGVISTTINKYVYVIVKPNYIDNNIVLNYFEKEKVDDVDAIKHGIIREALKIAKIHEGIEIISFTDLSLRGTGLGSSSAFTVGLLKALFAYQEKTVDAFELAELASHIEINLLGEPIGKQDQYAAAFGGLKEYVFCRDGRVEVKEVGLDRQGYDALSSHMVLYHTGIERKASSVLSDQKSRIEASLEHLHELKDIVKRSRQFLINFEIDKVGELLSLGWEKKKKLSTKIQNTVIEQIYHLGMKEGVYGGKLLGAGGGGYFCFLCPPEHQPELKKRLKGFNELSVACELKGSRVMSLEPFPL